MQGFPISAKLPEDLGFGERFWYWRGASGRTYIHSIYALDPCPPLAEAVFVLVETSTGTRRPVAVGRFPGFDSKAFNCREFGQCKGEAGYEVHVHLLARDAASAEAVWRDLDDALNGRHVIPAESEFLDSGQLSLVPC